MDKFLVEKGDSDDQLSPSKEETKTNQKYSIIRNKNEPVEKILEEDFV
jgi:hypothetical protein